MPIIHMIPNDSESFPEGANCPLYWNRDRPEHPVVVYETHHGLCLRERERNMYDDSDFFMQYWDEETQSVKEMMFGTTRGWSYPCMGSSVDATPEIKELAAAWEKAQDRKNRIMGKLARRAEMKNLATQWGMTYFEVRRIVAVYSMQFDIYRGRRPEQFERIDRLLRTKNFRSGFRQSLNDQIREWAAQKNPQYPTPLSRNQARAFFNSRY